MTLEERIISLEERMTKVASKVLHDQKMEQKVGAHPLVYLGFLFTAIYLILLCFFTREKITQLFTSTLDLNEVGDFLAGAFAPLAFLWVLIGVLVQSRELLKQVEQLRFSVEHQASIAETNQMQLDAYKPLLYIKDRRVEFDELNFCYVDNKVANFPYTFTFENGGAKAINVTYSVGFDAPEVRPSGIHYPIVTIDPGQSHTYSHVIGAVHVENHILVKGAKMYITVYGQDALGRSFRQDFEGQVGLQIQGSVFYEIEATGTMPKDGLRKVTAGEQRRA